MQHPRVSLRSLDTLWFQVSGTICNLACSHCLVSASPTNRTHEHMTLDAIRPFLAESLELGVKDYYFTGGEPFLNPEMESILEATLALGPATVLTNGLLLHPERCRRLKRLEEASDYSLDLRVSLDGYDAASNDPIRGVGTFVRILKGIGNLAAAGINPVITVTEVCGEVCTDSGKRKFFDLLTEIGVSKPRLKVLPLFHIGAEADRGGAYADWQRLVDGDAREWGHLQCSSSRMVTGRGVWVCPILVNHAEARMGAEIADALGSFPLAHQACWTCHVQGATCRT